MNALLVIALPVLAFLMLRKRPIPWPVLTMLLVGFGVLRNLPGLSILGT